MVKLKLFLGLVLGVGLYGFMSYYQPVTESYATTKQAEAQALQKNVSDEFISPLPSDLAMLAR